MSYVAPSPAMAITSMCSWLILPFLLRALIAASIPEAFAATFSNAVWSQGRPQEVYGYIEPTISIQPVACVTIVGPRRDFITKRSTVAGPHPAQALWPERNNSGLRAISCAVNVHS